MKTAREIAGLSRPALTTKFSGLKVRTLENNETGINEAGARTLEAFVRLGFNANWLLTGEGGMFITPDHRGTKAVAESQIAPVNVGALAAIIAAVDFTNPEFSAPERAALAAKAYAASIDEGLITPEGPGKKPDAAA